jgi:hypothetical protein
MENKTPPEVSSMGYLAKGVGPSTTLAWPGWKQPDIPVEVDTARLKLAVRTDQGGRARTDFSLAWLEAA